MNDVTLSADWRFERVLSDRLVEDSLLTKRIGNRLVVGHLEFSQMPYEWGDGDGEIILFSTRYSTPEDIERGRRALGIDESGKAIKGTLFAQWLSIYIHGARHLSLYDDHRPYPDEQWDVVRQAGAWVPDKEATANIKARIKAGEKDAAAAYVREVLETWNRVEVGDVYDIVVEEYAPKRGYEEEDLDTLDAWEPTGNDNIDTCVCFVGQEDAEKELKLSFDRMVETIRKEEGS